MTDNTTKPSPFGSDAEVVKAPHRQIANRVLPDVVRNKLSDAGTPGFDAEFDADEAEFAGAFVEDALSESDAAESAVDALDSDE